LILGGYGYLTEYRVSQTWRDARITSIYEGANGIHALAMVTRGLRQQGGAGPDAFDTLIGRLSGHSKVLALRERWRRARDEVEASERPEERAHDFTILTCALFFSAAWDRIAATSDRPELAYIRDKVLAAPFAAIPLHVSFGPGTSTM
jgi:hypothetical protein